MAFTVKDYYDLVKLLREHPEWRDELRSLLLTEELLSLPEIVRELGGEIRTLAEQVRALTEAQGRTEEKVKILTERVDALAEAQRRTEEEVKTLTKRVDALAEAQRRTEESLGELIEAHKKLEARVEKLEVTVGKLRGQVLEGTYARRAVSYFGMLLRRARVIDLQEVEDTLESSLSREEFYDLLRLDLLVLGRLRDVPEEPEVWLAVEVSATVDESDVERAARRAELLKKAGFKAIPVAAGEEIRGEAMDIAQMKRVTLMEDGRAHLWEETLERWVGSSKS